VRRLASSLRVVLAAGGCLLAAGGCGSVAAQQRADQHRPRTVSLSASLPHAHPQAVEPVAGALPVAAAPAQSSSVSVSGGSSALAQPVSNAQVMKELRESGLSASDRTATLTPQGLAIAPLDAPAQVQEVIDAGNEIAHLPYIWGGGHQTFIDTGYDCSGSLSFVLAAAGLLNQTETSGQLESYGDPGPGRWITIFANAGHTFAYIAGLRFDTVALAETGTRWSNRPADESNLSSFVVRHPPGL
jgi:cell wall-associated NlpC family hydrolase